ncbi:MAG: sulfurtransferase-like selenium metabolism protein YedF [Desulfotomaculaceae bacterium]|nr:sulfurtransferase-like selenium metabolism protein YedF [Desulfotomaculaceae bacterium]
MTMKVLDCRGLGCPTPVINTKKALEKGGSEALLVIVDNDAARENVSRFVGNAGRSVEVEEKDGAYHLTIGGTRGEVTTSDPGKEVIATEGEEGRAVYFITSNALGQGSPDLGEVLMKSLMVTLTEQKSAKALLLLNTGVYLALEGSPVLEQMQKLAEAGTEILVCGTCLNYYKLKEKLAVGVVSNMYDINSRLIEPGKVITVG